MNAVEEPEVRRVSALRELLASSDFLRLWLVGAFANAMRWLELLVSGLFAYEATGSAFAALQAARASSTAFLAACMSASWVSRALSLRLFVSALCGSGHE